MRVALCLSGQPRSFEEGFKYHKKNILDQFNCDVYMHTWRDVPNGVTSDLLELYSKGNPGKTELNTTDYLFNSTEVDLKYTNIPDPKFPARNTMGMWQSIWKSINMAISFGVQKYDVIIRSRYDYAINIKPQLEITQVNKIYVPADRTTPKRDFCADMFAWGTPLVMKKYGDTYLNIDHFYFTECVTMIGEDMLSAQLKKYGLIGNNMIYVPMNNPFPPGKYNGNWHSIIRDDFSEWNKLRD